MLKKIKIKNFRSLEDFEIEIKPLMLLFGQNSSGKSTFLKALMFLKENLFPLNTGKTKFQINKNVNLNSFEDIVTNNDKTRDIVFEFQFDGVYKFFNLNSIDKKFYESDEFLNLATNQANTKDSFWDTYLNNVKDVENFKKNLSIFNEFNVFDFYSKYIQNDNLDEKATDLLKSEYDCNYQLEITFSAFATKLTEKHLKSIRFFDRLNQSSIKFKYDFDEIILDEIQIKGFKEATNILKLYSDFKYNLFNFPYIPSYQKFINNKTDITTTFYVELLKLLYCSYILLPTILKSFFSYLHLPSLREIPEDIYLLEKNDLNKISNQYYGLLVDLASEQVKLQNLFAKINNKNKFISIFDNIIKLIIKYRNNTITETELSLLHNYSEQYFLSNSELKNNYSSSLNLVDGKYKIQQQSPEKIKQDKLNAFINNLIFNINIDLKRLSIKDYFLILYSSQFETAKIYAVSETGAEVYLSNSSSGMIQLLPIICFFNLINNEYKYNFSFYKYIDYILTKELIYDMDISNYYTVYIEQPELHLHPRLQCKIAELICENVKTYDRDTCMIIETHSEHIIKKIQVEIAKGNFDRNLIGVYYFDKANSKTYIKKMEIQDNGFFKEPWPDGFFDDSANLAWELLGASRKN